MQKDPAVTQQHDEEVVMILSRTPERPRHERLFRRSWLRRLWGWWRPPMRPWLAATAPITLGQADAGDGDAGAAHPMAIAHMAAPVGIETHAAGGEQPAAQDDSEVFEFPYPGDLADDVADMIGTILRDLETFQVQFSGQSDCLEIDELSAILERLSGIEDFLAGELPVDSQDQDGLAVHAVLRIRLKATQDALDNVRNRLERQTLQDATIGMALDAGVVAHAVAIGAADRLLAMVKAGIETDERLEESADAVFAAANIPVSVRTSLAVKTLRDLALKTTREILAVEGIGPMRLTALRAQFDQRALPYLFIETPFGDTLATARIAKDCLIIPRQDIAADKTQWALPAIVGQHAKLEVGDKVSSFF